jgi:hypothetical protein
MTLNLSLQQQLARSQSQCLQLQRMLAQAQQLSAARTTMPAAAPRAASRPTPCGVPQRAPGGATPAASPPPRLLGLQQELAQQQMRLRNLHVLQSRMQQEEAILSEAPPIAPREIRNSRRPMRAGTGREAPEGNWRAR